MAVAAACFVVVLVLLSSCRRPQHASVLPQLPSGQPVMFGVYFNHPFPAIAEYYSQQTAMCSPLKGGFPCAFISNWGNETMAGRPIAGSSGGYFDCPENDVPTSDTVYQRPPGERMNKCYAKFLDHLDAVTKSNQPDVLFIHDDVIIGQQFQLVLQELQASYSNIAFAPQFGQFRTVDLSDEKTWVYGEGVWENGVYQDPGKEILWGMTHPKHEYAARLRNLVRTSDSPHFGFELSPVELQRMSCDFPSGPCPLRRVNADVFWVPAAAQNRMAARWHRFDAAGLGFSIAFGISLQLEQLSPRPEPTSLRFKLLWHKKEGGRAGEREPSNVQREIMNGKSAFVHPLKLGRSDKVKSWLTDYYANVVFVDADLLQASSQMLSCMFGM